MAISSKKALSITLRITAVLFAFFIVLAITIHMQIQKNAEKKVAKYIDDAGLTSQMKYKGVDKNYFPSSININDVNMTNSFGCFDNYISSVVIKDSGGIKLKGINFDVLDIINCRFETKHGYEIVEYMKKYKPGWDTFKYPWLSLMLSGYRKVNADLEISFYEQKSKKDGLIRHLSLSTKVEKAASITFDIYYLDASNSIEEKKLKLFDNISNKGSVDEKLFDDWLEAFLSKAKIYSVNLEYKDLGFFPRYKEFVDKLSLELPDEPAKQSDINKLGISQMVHEMLEHGLSLDTAENIETAFKDFVESPKTFEIRSTGDRPVILRGKTWVDTVSNYIVRGKVEFAAE
jgi:hypothetical protein